MSNDYESDIYECFECKNIQLNKITRHKNIQTVNDDLNDAISSDVISPSQTFIEYFSEEEDGGGGDGGGGDGGGGDGGGGDGVDGVDDGGDGDGDGGDIVWSDNFGPSEIIQKVIDVLDPEKDKVPISELIRFLETMGYAAPEIQAIRFWGKNGEYKWNPTFTDICKNHFKNNPHVLRIYNSASSYYNKNFGFNN